MNHLQEYQLALERADKVNEFINAYSPGEDGLLRILKRIYADYLFGLRKIEEGDTYYLWQMYADYDRDPYIDFSGDYYVYDDDDFIMVERSIDYARDRLEDEYRMSIQGEFVRSVHRTKLLKEQLMMNVWHPRRIERLLEIGGEEALDNFAGV